VATSTYYAARSRPLSARATSIGTIADSFDNALAETTNGLYKAECVYGPDTAGWDDVDDLELATLSWVAWFNDRLHSHCDDVPPAEFEQRSTLTNTPNPPGLNPIARASTRPRAIQSADAPDLASSGTCPSYLA
jgi:putative transposase